MVGGFICMVVYYFLLIPAALITASGAFYLFRRRRNIERKGMGWVAILSGCLATFGALLSFFLAVTRLQEATQVALLKFYITWSPTFIAWAFWV